MNRATARQPILLRVAQTRTRQNAARADGFSETDVGFDSGQRILAEAIVKSNRALFKSRITIDAPSSKNPL
jgi:hypothetical protein